VLTQVTRQSAVGELLPVDKFKWTAG